jgi:hypothetical protein
MSFDFTKNRDCNHKRVSGAASININVFLKADGNFMKEYVKNCQPWRRSKSDYRLSETFL